MTDPEDREQQAKVTRSLLYRLDAPLAAHCRLRGVLPAPGAVRIAVRAGEDSYTRDFLYEIPHDTVSPDDIPGLLRTVLAGPQLYSSSDVGEAMGMTLLRLRPRDIGPASETEEGRALAFLRSLTGPADDENPFLIGFLLHGESLLRLYVRRPDRPGVIGVDVRVVGPPPTALVAALPSLVAQERHRRPAPDDPHCDLLVDLTDG
ncbi:hypothetical protein [Streptomyces mangrovisoli]|uniref:hypothetical protein n=1 Tax=Streptomyces mangrovisoli TaxID=1428628 RepID=UPI0011602879|nr:hypothetical protein [Streptomyces mangrovisoli]